MHRNCRFWSNARQNATDRRRRRIVATPRNRKTHAQVLRRRRPVPNACKDLSDRPLNRPTLLKRVPRDVSTDHITLQDIQHSATRM